MALFARSGGIHLLRTLIINGITAAVAAGLAANRRNNQDVPVRQWPPGVDAPFVEVVVPARDEEDNIVPLLSTLLNQSYPHGRWSVTVVDDGSTDNTRALAGDLALFNPCLRVVAAGDLPQGWTGKNHAMRTGFGASSAEAEWLLFVDADTRHHPDMISSVVARAQAVQADMLSLVIHVQMQSFWERVLVPQVGELYTLLVGTMDSVNSNGRAAAANGQFILIKRSLYDEVGGLSEVTSDVAEDRALAAAAKAHGASVRLEYGRSIVTARVYSSLKDLWAGYSKTMYWASGHNSARTLLVAAALAMYALVPPFALLSALVNPSHKQRRAALINAPLQMLPMLALRAFVCRQMGVPAYYALAYPLAVAAGDAMLLFSLYQVVWGKGVTWKGRTYTK